MLCLLVCCVSDHAGTAELTFLGDFEHGVIPLTVENTEAPWYNSGNPPVVVSAPQPVRFGRYAMKTVLNRKDRDISPISYRTEVVPRIDDKAKQAQMGADYWYGFSLYFPKEWLQDDIWEIVAQWHGRPDNHLGEVSRNPVMAFHSDGVNLKITNIWDAAPHTQKAQQNRPTKYDGQVTLWEGPIRKSEWTDWVVHVKWSYQDEGILEIWENGKQIARREGPNTFNDQKAPNFKMGLYKGWRKKHDHIPGIVSERILYHDEVRFAGPDGSYFLVSPPDTFDEKKASAREK